MKFPKRKNLVTDFRESKELQKSISHFLNVEGYETLVIPIYFPHYVRVKKEYTAYLEVSLPYPEDTPIEITLYYPGDQTSSVKHGFESMFHICSIDKYEDKVVIESEFEEKNFEIGKVILGQRLYKSFKNLKEDKSEISEFKENVAICFTKEQYFFFKELVEKVKTYFLPNSVNFINSI